MRREILATLFGALLLCSGCTTHKVTPAASDVPVPTSTPFDGNPKLRSAYLDGYRDGYTQGRSGALVLLSYEPGTLDARTRGFLAGNDAGLSLHDEQDFENLQKASPHSGREVSR
jgi:hypothetical protein